MSATAAAPRFVLAVLVGVVVPCSVFGGPVPQSQTVDGPNAQRQDQAQNRAIDRFTTRMVGNPNIREHYLDCFLDNGPCSPEADSLKQLVPDAIQRDCEHCTELQRKVIEKMMCYLNNHQPDILNQVAAKFDPNGEFMRHYIDTIERNGNGQPERPNLLRPQQPNPQQPQQPNPQQPQQPNPQQPQQPPNQRPPQQNNQNQPQQPPNQRPPQQNNQNQPQQPNAQRPPQQNNQQPSSQQPQENQQEQKPKTTTVTTAPIGIATRP